MKQLTPKIGMAAAAVAAVLVIAVLTPTNTEPENQISTSASASAFHAQTSSSRSEAPVTKNADPDLLSDEKFAALTDADVQAILAKDAAAVAEDQAAYAAEASPHDYVKAVEAFNSFRTGMDAAIKNEGVASVREKLETIAAGSTAATSAAGLSIVTVGSRCITIYKWQLQTIA
jgi:hypothetical protein